MEINLEKIELVKDRTGSTYADAKAALERNNGSVVDAIIDIEEQLNANADVYDSSSIQDNPLFKKMKAIIDKGNINKILLRRKGKNLVAFPVTVGVAGVILVPWVMIFGVIGALGAKCEIYFVDENGAELDINGKVTGLYNKTVDAVENVTGGKKMDHIKEYGLKALEKGKDAWTEFSKEGGTLEKIEKGANNAIDAVKDAAKKL